MLFGILVFVILVMTYIETKLSPYPTSLPSSVVSFSFSIDITLRFTRGWLNLDGVNFVGTKSLIVCWQRFLKGCHMTSTELLCSKSAMK